MNIENDSGLPRHIAKLASYFDDPIMALSMLKTSVYSIPLYYNDIYDQEIYPDSVICAPRQFYHLEKELFRGVNYFEGQPIKFAISELIQHLKIAEEDFKYYFRFPGESRKDRDIRIKFESIVKKRYIEWYREEYGLNPNTNYTISDFKNDYIKFREQYKTNEIFDFDD